MFDPYFDDIDYENLDDLPLFDHVEWSSCSSSSAEDNDQSHAVLDWGNG